MVEEFVDVVIYVKVLKKYVEEFWKEVEVRVWYLVYKKEFFENLKKFKGIMKIDKLWKEIKREFYEGFID